MLDNDDLEDLTEHWRESPPVHLALRALMIGLGYADAPDDEPSPPGELPTAADLERWVGTVNAQFGGKVPRV